MMNHNNSKYVKPSNNKNTIIRLNYIQTHKKKKKKSHINTKRETKQKAKCKLKL